MQNIQSPSSVVMIRPHKFKSNPETTHDNGFQISDFGTQTQTANQALKEFDDAVLVLEHAGVNVHVFDDHRDKDTPDSVFPNNWFSTHRGGHIALYPMYAANRQRERRWDVIEFLKQKYRVQDVIDYSGLEQDGLSLEGTGAMVIDYIGRIVYVAKSNRSDPVILERFCAHFNFEPMAFEAADTYGNQIYHTNVMMTVATKFALLCAEMITDDKRRNAVIARLEETGRDIILLSSDQIYEFAGNAIELTGHHPVLAMSSRAFASLTRDQCRRIEKSAEILPISIPTIETAGGSVRCMIAGNFLAKR